MHKLVKPVEGHKIQSHPTCFYLEWDCEVPRARWIHATEVPKDKIKFGAEVKWKDLRYDVYVASDTKNTVPFRTPVENPYRNMPYLKSHLQKAIRRSNPYKALKTAIHMADLDPTDFLRRLAIIAIEDCLPLEGFSVLIWLLAAQSKGYVISDAQFCWCLGYVYDLAMCPHYEQIGHEDSATPRREGMHLYALAGTERDLVYSVLFRAAYGGMKSDAQMCKEAARLWAARCHAKGPELALLQREAKWISYPSQSLAKSEWILAALDFHCIPNIIGAMWEKHDEFTEEQIKSAIWHCSSSVTNKKLLTEDLGQRRSEDPELLRIWSVIKKDFLGYAKFMLEKQG